MIYEGHSHIGNLRFAIVVARFNDFITKSLLEGALTTLKNYGASEENIDVVWVPGAFEIPVAAKKILLSKKPDAVICLGAIIRGETAHFEYVAGEAARGIAALALETTTPVILGVLATNTIDQALDRCGSKAGNKGIEAAMAAVEMATLLRSLS
ncbi:MAG: 6,7-dimethyl-8-ribityllumazine synthase [Candidatus Margulisiibacteriota bacterium]